MLMLSLGYRMRIAGTIVLYIHFSIDTFLFVKCYMNLSCSYPR